MFTSAIYAVEIDAIRYNVLTVSTIKEADNYIQLLETSNLKQANAYIAACTLMKAKLSFFPITKYRYFKAGTALLDQAILNDINNIEIRYLRFIFQSEIPKFLGYNRNINEDYTMIITNITNSLLPLKFKQKILQTMLLVKGVTANQTNEITNKLLKL
jgi:hypothetical protein